ncbi:MAG: dynamin family protein [Acidimicrobiales bacterium]
MKALGELEYLARRLATSSAHQPELARRAQRLAERIATQRFHIAILGEFKRGKSTLVNALIGRQLLPSGVVPLTNVATEVHFGSTRTTVSFADGRRIEIPVDAIDGYVTERGNPANTKGVDRVEVGVSASLGAPGLVLVDTPGIASVNDHNTTTAHFALADSDAAVLVLSADSPLSESELGLLTELTRRQAKVFVVINKADHLTGPELEEVRRFVADHLRQRCNAEIEPYCISARTALDGESADRNVVEGFARFQDALKRFVEDDLVVARRASVIAELARIAQSLDHSLEIEASAAAMDAEALSTKVERFEDAARDGRRQLDEDRVILDHDVKAVAGDIGRRLSMLAAAEFESSWPLLAAKVATIPRRQLDAGLREAIEALVRQHFEPVRRAVEIELEAAWEEIAARFADRVQRRVDELINVANQLFDVHLPKAPVPTVTQQRERFSYLFIHVEGPSAIIGQLVSSLLPSGILRHRARRLAERKLSQELDKHAGRARHDLSERIEATKAEFVAAMLAEFAQTETSLLSAAAGARSMLALTEEQRRERDLTSHDLRGVVATVAQVVARDAKGP